MPLIDFWRSNPSAVGEMGIEQIVATAGDGALRDGSKCSTELRQYLSEIASSKLATYANQCLENAFQRSGLVFQDLINEIGRRLDYEVENGNYQGTSRSIGFDGIWRTHDSKTLVVEVKTTDAYRISLDKIAEYRKKLAASDRIDDEACALIVVGRQDTGEVEAQIRGSRHAWDIRLISAEALIKLVQLKENSEGGATGRNIRILLSPMEYTRLDNMVDVMFTTATEVENAAAEERAPEPIEDEQSNPLNDEKVKGVWQFTDSSLIQAKRESIVDAVSAKLGVPFINKTKATLWSPDKDTRIAVTISKRYERRPTFPYWYAYHPQWDEFLSEGKQAFLVLGSMDLSTAFFLPRRDIANVLPFLNTTSTERTTYWHLHITEERSGKFALSLPKADKNLDLTPYLLSLR